MLSCLYCPLIECLFNCLFSFIFLFCLFIYMVISFQFYLSFCFFFTFSIDKIYRQFICLFIPSYSSHIAMFISSALFMVDDCAQEREIVDFFSSFNGVYLFRHNTNIVINSNFIYFSHRSGVGHSIVC